MNLSPHGALAGALERGRDRYNARFAYARRVHRGLDAGAFSAHLVSAVAPVLDAVAAVPGADVDAACDALYEASLTLVARQLAGPGGRAPGLALVWQDLLPALGSHVAADPRRVVAATCNAALRLGDGDALIAWVGWMTTVGPRCPSVDVLLGAGQVLAWRSGMAVARDGALAVWRELPDPIRRACLDLPDAADLAAVQAALANPWWRPDARGQPRPAVVARVGGHVALGGVFTAPPTVGVRDGALYAWDDLRCVRIHADRFGTSLVRAERPAPEGRPPALGVDGQGNVAFRGTSSRLPELADASSQASTPDTLAVAFARSHQVVLVAVVPG